MIVQCSDCKKYFDDEFRTTDCPHDTFLANDGQNNFKVYEESWLANKEPSKEKWAMVGAKSEHTLYQEWLNKNRVSTDGC